MGRQTRVHGHGQVARPNRLILPVSKSQQSLETTGGKNLSLYRIFHWSISNNDTLYTDFNWNTDAVNFIILVTKIYIYNASKSSSEPQIVNLVHNIEKVYVENQLAVKVDNKDERFSKTWY